MDIIKIIISGFFVGFLSALPVSASACEIIRRGFLYGFWAAMLVAFGTITSDILYSVLAFFGINNFIINNPLVRDIFGLAAAVIIAIIGLYIIYEAKTERKLSLEKTEKMELPPYITGVLITIFNPFVLLFWTGILGIALRSTIISGNKADGALFLASAIMGIIVWTVILARLSSLGKFKITPKFHIYSNVIIGSLLLISAVVIVVRIFAFG